MLAKDLPRIVDQFKNGAPNEASYLLISANPFVHGASLSYEVSYCRKEDGKFVPIGEPRQYNG